MIAGNMLRQSAWIIAPGFYTSVRAGGPPTPLSSKGQLQGKFEIIEISLDILPSLS